LYDVDSGSPAGSCKGHSAGIYTIAFSPDGHTLATGGFDGEVRLYNVSGCTMEKAFVPVPLATTVAVAANGSTR
jgi:WD40 repeat protein